MRRANIHYAMSGGRPDVCALLSRISSHSAPKPGMPPLTMTKHQGGRINERPRRRLTDRRSYLVGSAPVTSDFRTTADIGESDELRPSASCEALDRYAPRGFPHDPGPAKACIAGIVQCIPKVASATWATVKVPITVVIALTHVDAAGPDPQFHLRLRRKRNCQAAEN